MNPAISLNVLWVAWAASWFAASFWSSRIAKTAHPREERIYGLAMAMGALLIFSGPAMRFGGPALWPTGRPALWAAFGCAAAGFAFAWWARIQLGRLWSGRVTRKEDHRLIETGPYGIVRHPIYTGLIAALVATMAAKATIPAILGVGLMVLGIWLKARIEERFLRAELGARTYDTYVARVPMLIPFWPRTR